MPGGGCAEHTIPPAKGPTPRGLLGWTAVLPGVRRLSVILRSRFSKLLQPHYSQRTTIKTCSQDKVNPCVGQRWSDGIPRHPYGSWAM